MDPSSIPSPSKDLLLVLPPESFCPTFEQFREKSSEAPRWASAASEPQMVSPKLLGKDNEKIRSDKKRKNKG